MSWIDALKKVGQIAQVAAPIAVPQAAGAVTAGIAVVNTAIGLIEAATKDGKISEAEIAVINQYLIPHGLAVIHLKEDKKEDENGDNTSLF